MALRGGFRGAAWSWSRSDPDAKQVAEGTQVVDQGAVGHGVGHAVVDGPGDADRAGDGESRCRRANSSERMGRTDSVDRSEDVDMMARLTGRAALFSSNYRLQCTHAP